MKSAKHDVLDVDMLRLDRDWAEQPKLYHQFADIAASAKRELDDALNVLEEVKAKLYGQIAKSPEQYGLAKATENAINAAVLVHKRCIEAKQRVVEARYAVNAANAKVTALDHRKRALESLVKLMLADYGATPQAPPTSREAMDDMRKRRHYRSHKIDVDEELEDDDE